MATEETAREQEFYQTLGTEVVGAFNRVEPYVRLTPLEATKLPAGSAGASDVNLFLKLESEQVTGSFKARGAVNKLLFLSDDELKKGVVTASTGNHGRAVAYALSTIPRCASVSGKIYVPSSVAPNKLAALKTLGADVVVCESGDCVAAEAAAREEAVRTGATFISPYNDLQIIGGQGTAGCEIALQLAQLRAIRAARQAAEKGTASSGLDPALPPLIVLVPVGGGGLIMGVAAALKLDDARQAVRARCRFCSLGSDPIWFAEKTVDRKCYCAFMPQSSREVVIIGTQPETNACMTHSVEAGRLLEEGEFTDDPTLSDGTAGGVEAGSITWMACMKAAVDGAGLEKALAAAKEHCKGLSMAGRANMYKRNVQKHPHGYETTPWSGSLVDAIMTASEAEIVDAMRFVLEQHHKVIEGAAGTAVAVAHRLARTGLLDGCDVVALCCGGNVSTEKLRRVIIGDPRD